MPYKILPTKEFEKDFKKIDFFMRERIKKKVDEVADNPERYKYMHYDFTGSCRIRIGKYLLIVGITSLHFYNHYSPSHIII